tara:strand:+ start:31646 stop:32008 length:363 start_codon:yes stop_codon:yes gene_type:complete
MIGKTLCCGTLCDAQNRVLFSRAVRPFGFFSRLRGLIGHEEPGVSEAWWFIRCQAIHTFGMQYPIDVLHLSAEGRVLRICAELAPGRISLCSRGRQVVELRAGGATHWNIHVGSQLRFCP